MTLTTSLAVLLATSICTVAPADDRDRFIQRWERSHVVVQRTLYSLVYNERGRLGNTYRSRHEGLTVVIPPANTLFRFDGRDSEGDITGRDPQQVMDAITARYRRSYSLDVGSFARIEPLVLARYDAGVELVVTKVRIEQTRVRLFLAETGGDDKGEPATTLTVQWPAGLSRSFTERAEVERLIGFFLALSSS
jgi:hypothetical protein